MKYLCLVIMVCALFAFPGEAARAGGLPSWGGAYVGIGIGALGLSGTETDTHTVPPHVDTFDGGTDWGVMGTVTAGYDYQLPQGVIIGAFTDFDFTNSDFTTTSPDGDTNRLREHSAFNVGGRLGYLISPSTLLYADGGYTRGNFKFNYSDEYSNGKTLDGWFVGGGAEHKITGPWSAKLEYRFAQYGKEQVGAAAPPPPMDQATHSIDANSNSILLGVNYNLGGGGP